MCKYCEFHNDDSNDLAEIKIPLKVGNVDLSFDVTMQMQSFEGNPTLSIGAYSFDECNESFDNLKIIPIHYCPMCGRNLSKLCGKSE